MSLPRSLFGFLKYWSSRPEKGVQSLAIKNMLQAEEPQRAYRAVITHWPRVSAVTPETFASENTAQDLLFILSAGHFP